MIQFVEELAFGGDNSVMQKGRGSKMGTGE